MTADEAASFGPVLGRLTAAVREATGAERVYTWASMAFQSHLHVWLIPWLADRPESGPAYLAGIQTYACTESEALETTGKLRKALDS